MYKSERFDPKVLRVMPLLAHGGGLHQGRRKLARPLIPKNPTHVFISSKRASGVWSLLSKNNSASVQKILKFSSKRFHVQILQTRNRGKGLHLVVRAKTKKGFSDFLRTLTAQIATKVTGAKKGNAKGRFWDALAFSKIIESREQLAKLVTLIEDASFVFSVATFEKMLA